MIARGTGSGSAIDSVIGWTAVVLIVVTVLIGGGGASALPPLDAINQFAGFAALALLVAVSGDFRVDRSAWPWLVLALLAFLLPMAQLLPLPVDWVTGLPGRALADEIRAASGQVQTHLPLTLDPDQTLASALCMVPGIAAFALTLYCSALWRKRLMMAWVAMAMLALLLGGLQVASGGTLGEIYDTPHRLAATGFFANRNHHSLFMLIALLLGAALLFARDRNREPAREIMRLALLLALTAGILIASSRAGLLLTVVSLPVLALLMRGQRVFRLSRNLAIGTGAVVIALAGFLAFNPVARQVLRRFSNFDDARIAFWPDVVHTMGQFWPIGTGIGTFQAVYLTQERLGLIDEYRVNHAHNDFLELAIEGGIAAVLLMAAFAVLLVWRLFAVRSLPQARPRFALTAGFGLLLVLAHSLVDYPLRSITLIVMFGFLSGLMFAPAQRRNMETAA